MRTPCEIIERNFLSDLKIRVAKKLWKAGYRQKDIGELFGVTQPVVSELVRGEPKSTWFGKEAERLADEIVRRLKTNWDAKTAVELICQYCKDMKLKGEFCQIHYNALPSLGKGCSICMWLESGIITPDVINDVKDAVHIIESQSEKLIQLYPQVGINIARIADETSEKIVGIPGRIVRYHGRLKAFSSPELGGSSHNGDVLRAARRANSNKGAVINIKYVNGIESTLTELALKYERILRREGLPVETRDSELFEEIERIFLKYPESDAIIDPGAFGIEPTLYLFADTAVDVAKLAIRVGTLYLSELGKS
ncbi:MAG: hypothetical protein DRN90_04610 [Thermoproteota archaeon]|nr:MAG: hypothetical protein DRN90_04610 [Candidatus Korarchaeota archaeon]